MQNLKLLDYTKKRLDDMYLVMYAIKNDVNIKKGDIIDNIDIYTIVGINKRGIRQLVGIYQDRPLNNRYWLDIFENFKSRGLDTVLFLSVDDNKNFKRTAKIAFPMINFVDSLTYVTSKFNNLHTILYKVGRASKIRRSLILLIKIKYAFIYINCIIESHNFKVFMTILVILILSQ